MELTFKDVREKLTESDLDRLEHSLNIKLPFDYRRFLFKFNGGKPNKTTFRLKKNRKFEDIIHAFLSVTDDINCSFSEHFIQYKKTEDRIPNDVFPIAFDPGGNFICLGWKGKSLGKVFFWDHECEFACPKNANLRLIADSFQEFLDSLEP